jgi:Na+-translocating ferredoxin:NAD+ oxidoreductase RnfD subunit
MKEIIKNLWNNPWYLQAIFLFILVLVSLFDYNPVNILLRVSFSVFIALITDALMKRIILKKWIFPFSAIISGLIIAIALTFTVNYLILILTSFLAMIFKNLIRIDETNLFNPANLGLLVVCLIFNPGITWWGVVNPWIMILFLITMYKVNKYPILISFIMLFSFLEFIINGFNFNVLYIQFLALLFWMFVMLIEPITSPNSLNGQIIFGAITAAAVFGFNFIIPSYSMFAGLVFADIFVPIIKKYT